MALSIFIFFEMQHFTYALCVYWVLMGCHTLQSGSENSKALKVSRTEGLIAFWDFYQNNDTGHAGTFS